MHKIMVGDGKFQQNVFVQRVLDEKCSSSVAAQTGQVNLFDLQGLDLE